MARLACGRSGDEEQVPSRTDPLQPRPDQLSQPATHPIALNGAPERPRRRQPDSRLGPIGPQPAEDQQRGRARGALTADGLEVRAAPEGRQHSHVFATRLGGSGGQPLAPLGPTTSEHAATALRSHAGHEAMLALARALLGLIRPLHECVPFPRSAFAFRVHHIRTAGVPPACAHEFGGPSRSGAILVLAPTPVKLGRAVPAPPPWVRMAVAPVAESPIHAPAA
jgi:hypothetical protein